MSAEIESFLNPVGSSKNRLTEAQQKQMEDAAAARAARLLAEDGRKGTRSHTTDGALGRSRSPIERSRSPGEGLEIFHSDNEVDTMSVHPKRKPPFRARAAIADAGMDQGARMRARDAHDVGDDCTFVTVGNLRRELWSLAQDSFLREFSEIGSALQRDYREELRTLCDQVRSDIRHELEDLHGAYPSCSTPTSSSDMRRQLVCKASDAGCASSLGMAARRRAESAQDRGRERARTASPPVDGTSFASEARRRAAGATSTSTSFNSDDSPSAKSQKVEASLSSSKRAVDKATSHNGQMGLSLRAPAAAPDNPPWKFNEADADNERDGVLTPKPPPQPASGKARPGADPYAAYAPADTPPELPFQAMDLPCTIPDPESEPSVDQESPVASMDKTKKVRIESPQKDKLQKSVSWKQDRFGTNRFSSCEEKDDGSSCKPCTTGCQADEAAGGVPAQRNESIDRMTSTSSHRSETDMRKSSSAKNARKSMAEDASKHKLTLGKELARRKANTSCRKPLLQFTAKDVLQSSKFDNMVGALILLNAVTIGVQTDIMAKEITDTVPVPIQHIEKVFLIAFSAELALRLYVHKHRFFCMESKYWNWFDFTVVTMQLLEEMLLFIAGDTDETEADSKKNGGSNKMENLKLMRVLRILRLMRILRVMRVLRLISELRTIVSSIVGSMKSLAWTIVLLSLFIYIVGVYFTQSVNDHMVEISGREFTENEQELRVYFGTLMRTLLSLYQAMSGGLDWDTLAAPLINEINWTMGIAIVAYIAFAILALMNVVTGVFVQTALQSAKNEEDQFLTDQIVNLFKQSEDEAIEELKNGRKINWEEVQAALTDPLSAREWKSIDVQPEDAKYLFFLLDIEQDGEVMFEEFLSGCLRLHGCAKAIDLLTIMQELRSFYLKHSKCHEDVVALQDGVFEELLVQGDKIQDLAQAARNIQLDVAYIMNASTVEKKNSQELRDTGKQIQEIQAGLLEIKRNMSSLTALNDLLSHVETPDTAQKFYNNGTNTVLNLDTDTEDLV